MVVNIGRVFTAFLLSLLVSGILSVSPARAVTGTISWTGAATIPGGTCGSSAPMIFFNVTGTTDDGAGADEFSIQSIDGNGNLLDSIFGSRPVGLTISATVPISITGITARPITVRLIDDPGGTVLASDTIDPASFVPDCANLPLAGGGGGGGGTDDDDDPGPPFIPGDDRLNVDAAAPLAVYCRDDGIHVYSIDRFGKGHLAFIATFNEINAVGVPAVNTLIDSGAGIGLYRLTSGEFQVNTARVDSEQPKRMALVQQDGGPLIHIVQRGENLFRLAIRYGTTVQAIAAANGIVDVTRIYVGQRLIIPAGSTTPGTQPGPTGANPPLPSSAGIGAGYVFIFRGC